MSGTEGNITEDDKKFTRQICVDLYQLSRPVETLRPRNSIEVSKQ